MGAPSQEIQSAGCQCCQHSYFRPSSQRRCSYKHSRTWITRKAAATRRGSHPYGPNRTWQVQLERWRQLRCNAAEQPPPPPPPGRNPASSQRMRNLGFGQEQNRDTKGQRPQQGQRETQAGSPDNGGPLFRPPWKFNGNQKRSTSKPGSPKERSSFLRGDPDNGDELASAISQAQLPGGNAPWDDWAAGGEDADWDDPQAMRLHTDSYKERRRKAWEAREAREEDGTPRDSFLRPMVDLQGAKARLGFNAARAAQEIEEEFDENRWESQEALKYAAFLIGVPLLVGYTLSRLLADPFFEVVLAYNPNAFALSDKTKVEGAKEIHRHDMRLRMDAALGRAPPLTEQKLQLELRREAKSLERKFKERNRQALLNVLSDGTSGSLIFAILLRKTEGRAHLFRTLARLASGLSDTAKAFLIIAGTDILLGYHSEEGWTAALRLLSEHYGMEAEDKPIYIFVAIVPVVMDAIFKYWIFKGLNRENPAAAATLRNMDRH